MMPAGKTQSPFIDGIVFLIMLFNSKAYSKTEGME
jgi:hypothetical protein